MLLCLPASASAQGFFDEFSYDGLGFSGIGLEVGPVFSNRLDETVGISVRVDAGLIAPRVRVLLGAGYFKSDFKQSEIAKFEMNILEIVDDPTNDATIDVGTVSWANFQGDLDLQYLVPFSSAFLGYFGLGLGLYVRNGSGAAIQGTFIEDALDTVAAGVNLSAGLEAALSQRISVTGDARGMLSTELLSASFRLGLQYRIRPWVSQ